MSVAPEKHRITVYRHRVRYLEVDQQGVVFNMWYLGYFDEAMSEFFAEGGLPYPEMLASGYDVQLVHSEIDWRSSLRSGDEARVEVSLASIGATSFTLWFAVYAAETLVASGRTVYVVVATDGSGKRPLPPSIRAALGALPGEA
ncbi:MAG TPA: thioesterase family protein [Acidimicrobiales bacterium]|nr:thioesterase family protein [Acidimicrobiales bacterium]